MQFPEALITLFSAEIEDRNGEPVVVIPEQELELGDLEVGERYRVAVLRSAVSGGEATPSRSMDDRSTTPRGEAEPPVKEGERREVEIEDIGDQGDGIARIGPGYIVFVPGTDVGDRVTVEITRARENFAFADVVEDEPISG